jgi:hypothetical protein
MKYLAFTLAAVAYLAVVTSLCAEEELEQAVLARINEKVLTRHDVEILLALTGDLEKAKAEYHGEELEKEESRVFNEALAFLINEAVFLVNAKLDGIEFDEIDKKQAEMILERSIEPFVTQANFEFRLKERSLTIEDVKERNRRTMLIEKYKRKKLAVDNFITPEDARKYYEKNKSLFLRRVTVARRQIEISFGAGNRTRGAARKLIKNILKNLEEGSDFGVLAKQFSEGPYGKDDGLWPHKAEDDLVDVIANEIKKLKEGEVSGIIQRSDAFLIVKLEERDCSPYEPFEKALDKIVIKLGEEKRRKIIPEFKKEMYSRIEIELAYAGAKLDELCPDSVPAGSGEQGTGNRTAP